MRPEYLAMCPGLITCSKEHDYAERLIALIVEMARRETNIILQLLNPQEPIIYEQKYPDKPVMLANEHLCVYYHAHKNNLISDNEHGHFHFFLNSQPGPPSHPRHLVALSIDHYGQPRAWFTVNQWVTAGAIYDRHQFHAIMSKANIHEQGSLTQNWLLSMLLFYQHEIGQLMDTSQEVLQTYESTLSGSETPVCENRDIYFLRETCIDLSYDLANSTNAN